jgi:allantoate deiminase
MDLDALTEEVLQRCDTLATYSEDPPALTRTFLSAPMHEIHTRLTEWMQDAGLNVRIDAVGNVIGSTVGETTFVVGSHVDTVPNAGKYDGPLGVLLGIAAAKALREKSFPRRLDVIAFSEEEGVQFGFPYIGSNAVCGKLTPEMLARQDAHGLSVVEAIEAFGLNPAAIPDAAYAPGSVAGYLEAHIEQGPVLESKNLALGIVPAIMGQTRAWLTFTGKAGHAGTQPMNLRHDALAAAAMWIGLVESCGRHTPGMRATVGHLTVSPNVGNVIPGEVRLSLDLRHAEDAIRKRWADNLLRTAETIAHDRGLTLMIERTLDQAAVPCDTVLSSHLTAAMKAEGHPTELVLSGAGHDAVVMAGLCPMAMLFLRSPGGISHHPDERVLRQDVRAALAVMLRFLERELYQD